MVHKFDKIRKDPVTGEKVVGFPGVWRYSKVKAAQGVAPAPLPSDYILPWVQYLFPKDQGGQGSCVGESMAYVLETIYLKLTNDFPTDADKAKAQYNIPKPIGPHQTTVDIAYPQTFSDACCYYKSRDYGNVTDPSGSYIDYAVAAALKWGACRQWQWWLSQNGTDEWTTPYPDTDPETSEAALTTAANHKIEGYAQCTTQDSIKRAIFDHQWAVESAWEVYENFTEGQADGHWPPPKGDVVGGHAMAIVGWTSAGEFIVLQSWRGGNWPLLNYLPASYWPAFVGAIVPLDSAEAKFGRGVVYQKVEIKCSDNANVTVNGKFIAAGTDFTVDLEIGSTATIVASATGWNETITQSVAITSDTKVVDITFRSKPVTPPTPPTPTPTPSLADQIRARIKAVVDALKKKFGGK